MKRTVVTAFTLAIVGFVGGASTAHAVCKYKGDVNTYTKGSVACQDGTQQECTEDNSWKDLGIPCHEVIVGEPGMLVVGEEAEAKIFKGYTLCCAGDFNCPPACGWCLTGCAGYSCKGDAAADEFSPGMADSHAETVIECKK